MKILKRMECLVIVFCLAMTITGYASELEWGKVVGYYNECTLLSESELSSINEYYSIKRGEILSGVSSEIRNEQNGTMTIIIATYAHHDVDKVFHTAFLDKWDDDLEDWQQIKTWDFEQYKEDTDDGTISFLSTTIKLSGYETNKYYRVRALHGVKYNGDTEACATRTDGVLITDGPT